MMRIIGNIFRKREVYSSTLACGLESFTFGAQFTRHRVSPAEGFRLLVESLDYLRQIGRAR